MRILNEPRVIVWIKTKTSRKLESQWFLVASVRLKEYLSQAKDGWSFHPARITERAFAYFRKIAKVNAHIYRARCNWIFCNCRCALTKLAVTYISFRQSISDTAIAASGTCNQTARNIFLRNKFYTRNIYLFGRQNAYLTVYWYNTVLWRNTVLLFIFAFEISMRNYLVIIII